MSTSVNPSFLNVDFNVKVPIFSALNYYFLKMLDLPSYFNEINFFD